MKVLLFSNDLMPFGTLPTSGGGLRCYQIMKGLEYHGIKVIASMPGFTYLAEKHKNEIPEEQREYLWEFETQDNILNKVKPDAVIFASNWDHYNLTKKPTVPLIVDLHGSRLIETAMWDRPASPEKKVSVLSKADCVTCAGRRQRLFYYGWLLQAGRFPAFEHFIRYIPVALSPELPLRKTNATAFHKSDLPIFVSGGGWFPWQNQSKAIFAIAKTIERKNKGRIQIYGTPHEQTGSSPEEQKILDVYKKVEELSRRSQRIQACGYVGREELLSIYANADLAVEAMEYNLERELAFTTRTIEYLWCGLPVIYNNFGEISEHIKEYNAGWTVDASNEVEIQKTIDEIFSRPDLLEQKSKNAQCLVKDRFTWDKAIQPLVDFLKNPIRHQISDPVMGIIYTRPSFLQAKGNPVDLPLTAEQTPISQRFIVPAENITALEIPFVLTSADSAQKIKSVELIISTLLGRTVCRKKILAEEVLKEDSLTLKFPLLLAPAGGEELKFSLKINANQYYKPGQVLAITRGLNDLHYPLVAEENWKIAGKDNKGSNQLARGLALSFMPAEYSTVYKLKLLSSRALYLIRQGELKRVARAVKRRMPQLIRQLRAQ